MHDFIDEVVAGLPRKKPSVAELSSVDTFDDDASATGGYGDEEYDGPRRRWPWVVVGVALSLPWSMALGMAVEPTPAPSPQPTVTVTRTIKQPVAVESFPQSCIDAMHLIQQTLPDQAAIVSAGDPQLDVLDEAYRALMAKDYTKLNEVAQRQRRLQSSLAPHTDNVLQSQHEINRLVDQCSKDIK